MLLSTITSERVASEPVIPCGAGTMPVGGGSGCSVGFVDPAAWSLGGTTCGTVKRVWQCSDRRCLIIQCAP